MIGRRGFLQGLLGALGGAAVIRPDIQKAIHNVSEKPPVSEEAIITEGGEPKLGVWLRLSDEKGNTVSLYPLSIQYPTVSREDIDVTGHYSSSYRHFIAGPPVYGPMTVTSFYDFMDSSGKMLNKWMSNSRMEAKLNYEVIPLESGYKFSGECWIRSIKMTANPGEPLMLTTTFTPKGDIKVEKV